MSLPAPSTQINTCVWAPSPLTSNIYVPAFGGINESRALPSGPVARLLLLTGVYTGVYVGKPFASVCFSQRTPLNSATSVLPPDSLPAQSAVYTSNPKGDFATPNH